MSIHFWHLKSKSLPLTWILDIESTKINSSLHQNAPSQACTQIFACYNLLAPLVFMWLSRVDLTVKDRLQISQANGFSPVWILICRTRSLGFLKDLGQWGHWWACFPPDGSSGSSGVFCKIIQIIVTTYIPVLKSNTYLIETVFLHHIHSIPSWYLTSYLITFWFTEK